MPEIVLLSPGGATEATQADILTALNVLLVELQQKVESGQAVALDSATLASLETVSASVTNLPADYPDAAVLAKAEAVRALLAGDGWIKQTLRVSQPASVQITGPVADQVLVAAGPTERIRVIRNAGHIDPELGAGNYPVVTVKIGTTVVYRDKMEPGLPWSETVCFEGALGEDLTISVSTSATVYVNCRYEVF